MLTFLGLGLVLGLGLGLGLVLVLVLNLIAVIKLRIGSVLTNNIRKSAVRFLLVASTVAQ